MSNYQTIFLGAYIQIPTQYEEMHRMKKYCSLHPNNTTGAFCPECGGPITEKRVIEQRGKWTEELIGSERLTHHFQNDKMYLYSNLGKGEIAVLNDRMYPLNQLQTSKLISEFEEHHIKEIKILEEIVGEELEIYFGMLITYG
jgi:hypothetical protein